MCNNRPHLIEYIAMWLNYNNVINRNMLYKVTITNLLDKNVHENITTL